MPPVLLFCHPLPPLVPQNRIFDCGGGFYLVGRLTSGLHGGQGEREKKNAFWNMSLEFGAEWTPYCVGSNWGFVRIVGGVSGYRRLIQDVFTLPITHLLLYFTILHIFFWEKENHTEVIGFCTK